MKDFVLCRKKILEPLRETGWASEMVLNPAIIKDKDTGRIHMLFRATGPCAENGLEGKPLPYPISLGYGWSDDDGENWEFDRERPALFPTLCYEIEDLYTINGRGEKAVNYVNGCIEDPRLFYLEGECYLTVAGRMFPPGPYWEKDEPTQCAPDWIHTRENPFGIAASKNVTVTVLYRVDLARLAAGDYDNAFTYLTNLTDPEHGEDRDVVFFPEKLCIDGKKQMVMLHRPCDPSTYDFSRELHVPSMFICSGDDFYGLSGKEAKREVFCVPGLEWEKNRIGMSAPPLRLNETEWLLNYHGKKDDVLGYTQSFMIVEESEKGFPVIKHKCTERVLFAKEDWELPNKFKTPCIFVTGMLRLGEKLLLSYGAADEFVGIMLLDFEELVKFIRRY